MQELRTKYAWADDDHDLAWTVTVCERVPIEAMPALYGATSDDQLDDMTFGDAMTLRNDHFDEYAVVQFTAHANRSVAIEPNGWIGIIPQLAHRASAAGGHFFSVYWSPSACRVLEVSNSRVIANFEPTFMGLLGGIHDLLPDWVSEDCFCLSHPKASCLAAMEQRTGVVFDRGWLDTPLPTYRVPDPDQMLNQH